MSISITAPIKASSYEWSIGSNSSSIEVNSPGWYSLRVQGACFNYLDSVLIEEFPVAKFVTLGDDKMIIVGDSVLLTPTMNRGIPEHIIWSVEGVNINCLDCKSHWFAPEIDTRISIEVEDNDGCMLYDEILIDVEYEKFLYVPNIFSPNGDGINDQFYISSSVPGTFHLSVYNRWGNLIFRKENCRLSDQTDGWDGLFQGKYLNSGAFVWIAEINYISGEKETKYGDFLIVSR